MLSGDAGSIEDVSRNFICVADYQFIPGYAHTYIHQANEFLFYADKPCELTGINT